MEAVTAKGEGGPEYKVLDSGEHCRAHLRGSKPAVGKSA